MKLFSLALLLVLAVAVSAQIGPEKDFHFQDGQCSRTNDNCNWIVGHWTGFVTSHSTSIRFFATNNLPIPLVNTPWAQEIDDLFCTDRPYEIPYDCTFGYSEEDNHLYQYCWFGSVTIDICGGNPANLPIEYIRSDDGLLDTFYPGDEFVTPGFFSTNRISSLENGISFTNLETGVIGCLPYDVASKDLIIGNLWDGFSPIGSCSSTNGDDFGPSPVLPSSCDPFFISTTTPSTSTTSTTSTSTTSTTSTSTTSTTSTSTTSTTSTTTTPTTTTPTTTTTTTPTTTTTTTTTTHTTSRSLNPTAWYGCSSIFYGQNAVYGFELARVRPASFPYNGIDYSNSRCTGSKDHNCACVRSSSACNWLVGRWSGVLYAKGYNSFVDTNDDYFYNDPVYPFPLAEEDVRCQWGESATNFECAYYFNEETGYLNSHCWYDASGGQTYVGASYTTYAWEQWTEISDLNNGLRVSVSSATFLSVDECIPLDRFDSDTFIAQFPDGFSSNPTCGSDDNSSPSTVFDCVDGVTSNSNGNNNQFTLNYRNIDASWHDWDASSSLSPLIALSLLLAALLALF